MHDFNSFVTLTFAEEFVPPELSVRDYQLFMKRIRKRSPFSLRFFVCGEYGDLTCRPHYHFALFGYPFWHQEELEKAWPFGRVQSVELNEKTAAYVAGYVAKKYENLNDRRLEGKFPEFTRMSNRPGIGLEAARLMADQLVKDGASRGLVKAGDVPSEVRINGRMMPLGRYLRDVIRENVGWEKGMPVPAKLKVSLERSLMTSEDLRDEAKRRRNSAAQAERRLGRKRLMRRYR